MHVSSQKTRPASSPRSFVAVVLSGAALALTVAAPAGAQVQVAVATASELATAITTANGDLMNDYELLLTADIVLTSALPDVTSTVLVKPNSGPPGSGTQISRDPSAAAFRLFSVRSVAGSAGELSIEDLTLANGLVTGAPAQGGAIWMASSATTVPKASLSLLRTTVRDNTARGNDGFPAGSAEGGAIWAGGDTFLTVVDSVLQNNGAVAGTPAFGNGGSAQGGAIYITRLGLGQTSVTNIGGTTFRDNQATASNGPASIGGGARGGALRSLESKIHFNGGNEFIDNVATGARGANTSGLGEGGALYIADPEASANQTISGDRFTGNRAVGGANFNNGGGAQGRGGAIVIEYTGSGVGGPLALTDVEVRGNSAVGGGSAPGHGGGLYLLGSPALTVTRTALVSNSASDDGGGLYLPVATTAFTDSCIVGNSDLAYFASSSQAADGVWWGHPSGPGPPGGSGLGDTVSAVVTVASWLAAPPAGVACNASVPFDCSSVALSPGAVPATVDITFTTAEAGFTGLAWVTGVDVLDGGLSPAGCGSSGSDPTCTATVTLTSPGSGSASATWVVRTPSQGPTTCTFTSADGLPVALQSYSVD